MIHNKLKSWVINHLIGNQMGPVFINGIFLDEEDIRRFKNKIIRYGDDDCWEWVNAKDPNGYGHIHAKNKIIVAHRLMYVIETGQDVSGLFVLHTCDNPSCVNPKHLFLGDNSDNMQDMLRKGRGNKAKGESHADARLTEKEVREIRLKRASGASLKELQDEYGVSVATISKVANRDTWKHVK